MNTDISIGQSRDLYAYWQEALTAYLQEEIEKENHAVVLNLASNQYSDVVNFDDLSVPVVDVEFKEDRDGESKTIAIYLKKARGMMIHYCIQHMATTIDQVFGFKEAGYQLQEQSDTNLVFVRD